MEKNEASVWLNKFVGSNDLGFSDCAKGYQLLSKAMDEHPDLADNALGAVNVSLGYTGFCSDTAPLAIELFCKAAEHVEIKKLVEEYDKILKKNTNFAMRCVPKLLEIHPDMAQYFFDNTIQYAENCNGNNADLYGTAALMAIVATNDSVEEKLKEVTKNANICTVIYRNIDKIYNKHFKSKDQILEFLEKELTPARQGDYYKALAFIAISNLGADEHTVYLDDSMTIDADMPKRCLALMEQHVSDEGNDAISLVALYKSAGKVREIFPEYEERATKLINTGLEHHKNNKISRKVAYRVLGDYEKLCSQVNVYKRDAKSDENPYGFEDVSEVDNDKPCILALGGDGVRYERGLNGYLGDLYRLMEAHNLHKKVNVYGVVYDFGEYMDVRWARIKLMHEYHHNVDDKELNAETKNPKYVKDIFDMFIEPRLGVDGHKFSESKAAQNIRKLQIFAHCHGAYTALRLENMMQKRMEELGYSKESRDYIQKQLLIVSQSPYCPLGASKSTMVSFASAWDMEMDHCNMFEQSLHSVIEAENIPLCYFPDDRGNLFLTDRMGYGCDNHNFWGFVPDSLHEQDARKMIVMEANCLVSGVENALAETGKIGSVKDLVCRNEQEEKWYNEAFNNGIKVYNKMFAIAMGVAKFRSEYKNK